MKTDTQFTKRTYSLHYDMTKRAGKALPFTLEELRAWVAKALTLPLCVYCRNKLSGTTWSFDHVVPVSRGGAWDLFNGQLVCKGCNSSKGDFTDGEYRTLLRSLDGVEIASHNFTIKARVVNALRISNSFRQGAMRRKGKG